MRCKIIGLALVLVALSGCANFNTAFREYDSKNSVMVDVKQRAIISRQTPDGEWAVCAEPSPDALSVYAAQASGSVSVKDQVSTSGSLAMQESGAFVGLRTQSIQLLRDALYRQCESYANGAISKAKYEMESKRYQRNMVVLLAIEQLTGAVRTAPVTIATSGGAAAAQGIQELLNTQQSIIAQRSAAQAKSDTLGKQIDDAKAIAANADSTQADKDKANALVKTSTTQKANIDAAIDGYNDALAGIKSAMQSPGDLKISGSAEAKIGADSSNGYAESAATVVAKAVTTMVSSITNGLDDVEEMCINHLENVASGTTKDYSAELIDPKTTPERRAYLKRRDDAGDALQKFCYTAMKAVGNKMLSENPTPPAAK